MPACIQQWEVEWGSLPDGVVVLLIIKVCIRRLQVLEIAMLRTRLLGRSKRFWSMRAHYEGT